MTIAGVDNLAKESDNFFGRHDLTLRYILHKHLAEIGLSLILKAYQIIDWDPLVALLCQGVKHGFEGVVMLVGSLS